MATQNINIGVNVSDNGTAKKTVKNFQEITQAATEAQRAAAGINVPVKSTMAPGGTSGSRKAAAPTGSQQMLSGEEYGRARGTAGTTGASARDIANPAQGLGGLVRLYATLAANVFAASAAFTALKNAADTTNLIRGLDTLGAVSGQSLGTLSKRLVEVTDGAISMREAMTATAQASSAGMSGKNIERLALVAKNASLALGVAMPDALSRLSRGIVKLEPELLDELGLFTKIGPATERYALEIGKSVNALSDFERRQAFANAVLEEGEKKFGALAEAAANPYDKLLATLKNVIQSGLEVVNKVLMPVVSLLAESPAALGAVLAGIGVILLKQALPAIGQLRAGLRNSAEEALKASEAFKASFGDKFQTILEKRFKIPDLEAGVKKAQADLDKLKPPKNLVSVQKLAAGDAASLTTVKNVLENRNNIVETGMQGSKKASEAQIASAKQEALYIQKTIDLYQKKQALATAREGTENVANKPLSRFDPEVIALQKYDKLRSKVDQTNAISNAAQVAQVSGIRVSWQLLNREIADKGIKGFARFSTLAQGGLAAVGTRLMGVLGALGQVGQVIGIAVAAFTLLDSWVTKNAKQAEKLNSALTTAQEAMANVARTITAASTIDGFATRTIANTVAFSNALNEVSGSLSDIIKLSRETDKASNGWDNLWDGLFSFVGKDRASKLAKTVAGQIQSSFDLLKREGLADEYKAQVQKILQIDDIENVDKVAAAFKKLSKEQQNALIAIQNNSNRLLGNAGSALQSFKDKTDEALKAQKTLSNSFLDTSPAFKYGESLVAVSSSLNALIAQGPDRVAQALEEISTNMEKAAMFGPEFVNAFGKISSEFGKQKAVIDGLNSALVTYQEQLSLANTKAGPVTSGFADTAGGAAVGSGKSSKNNVAQQQASIANSNVREVQRALQAAPRDAVDKSIALVEAASKSLFERGMAFIGKAVREAQTAASVAIGKALTSNLTGPQKLQADAAYAQQEIKARLADIKISEEMLDTQTSLVNEMKLANALQAEANAIQKNAGKADQSAVTAASKDVQKARLGASGVGATGMVNSDLLSDKEKANIKADIARQKSIQQAALKPAKILAGGQLNASQLGLKGDLPLAQLAQEEELKKIADKTTASLLARQEIMSNIASVTTAEIIANKQSLDLKEKANQQARELEEITARIQQAESKYADAVNLQDRVAQDTQLQQISFLNKVKKGTEEAQKADTSVIDAKNKQQLIVQELSDLDKRYEVLKSTSELENQIAVTRLDTNSQVLNLQASVNEYSQQYVIALQTSLDKEKALLDSNIAMQQAQDTLNQKREAAEIRIQALTADGAEKNKAYIDAETSELARQETLTNNTIAGLANQYNSKVSLLDQTKQINTQQAKYNELLQNSSLLATSLADVFGAMGAKIGVMTSAITEFAVASEKNAKSLLDLETKRAATTDPKLQLALDEEIATQRTKNTRTELAGNTKLAGSAKSLFKEKTGAYKVFAAVERGFQVASLALEIKTSLKKMGLWAAEVPAKVGTEAAVTAAATAGAAARAPTTFGEIVGNYLAKIPAPFGMIAGVAAGAFFLRLLGKSGGGGGGAFVPTAEQRQETQGTAMGWDSQGNKVQVRQGVLGDTSAKSAAIANSLERLEQNSVAGLDYDNKMLAALKRIANGIEGAAKGLYRIPGLVSGSISGTMEGSSSGGNWLTGKRSTSTQITDSGVQILGNMYELFRTGKARINLFETVSTTSSSKGFLGFGGGSSTSVNILFKDLELENKRAYEQLLKALGAAGDMVYAMAEYAGVAEDVVSTALQSLSVDELVSLRGLKGEEFINELQSLVGALVSDSAYAIMGEYEQFANFGEDLFETIVRVQNSNKGVRQQLKNMMMQDIEATLGITGVVPKYRADVSRMSSSITWATGDKGHQDWSTLANMGGEIATGLQDAYNKTSGGAGFTELLAKNYSTLSDEDVQRLRDAGFAWANQITSVIEDGITRSFDQADIQLESAKITEDLIKRAGSEEQFFEQSLFFMENFQTEAERLAPRQKAATAELARLAAMGYTSADGLVDTREEFKKLVQSLDLTDPAIRAVYQSLMAVQDDFVAMTPELKTVGLSAKDLAERLKSMRMSILELTGTPEQLLAAQRAEILSETDERLRTTQQYIFALEDVKTAEANLTKARENEVNSLKQQKSTTDSTINSLKNYINSLKKFKDSLLLGSASPLTPAQRYAESKSQFDAILATAMGTAVTPEEQRTKDAALSQLESSASAFLDASRIYNASSAQYTEDFGLVQSALSNTETALTSQLTTEEKSLLALESQISALESQLSVSKSMLTVLEATQALIAAQATASQLKSVDLRQTAMSTKRAVIDDKNIFGAQGEVSTQNILGQNLNAWMANAKAAGTWAEVNHFYDNLVNKWGFNSTEAEWLLGVPKSELLSFFGSYNLPAFAMGTNFVPEDMVAQIHQGERIIPAADNMELMASIGNRNKTNEILVAEIRKLNQKIDSLEKTVANGSIINAEATNRNTVEITNSVKDTKTTASYSEALRRRTQVV